MNPLEEIGRSLNKIYPITSEEGQTLVIGDVQIRVEHPHQGGCKEAPSAGGRAELACGTLLAGGESCINASDERSADSIKADSAQAPRTGESAPRYAPKRK